MSSLEQLLSELIAVRSVAGDREECAIALDICRNALSGLPEVQFHDHVKDGQPSLVALYKADRNPDVLIVCHADVVPAPASSFAPRAESGRIMGRGSIDMKGPLTAMIRAFQRHASARKKTSVGLMITTDEEVGGERGAGYLMEEKGYRAGCAILPDAPHDFRIVTLQYGIVRIRVMKRGKAAHSSTPEKGKNAIVGFQATYREFEKQILKIPDTVWSLAKISGGIAMNVVPDLCEASIDIRTGRTDEVLAMLKRIFRRGEYEVFTNEPFYAVDPKHPCVRTFRRIAEKTLGRRLKTLVLPGATDARHLAPFGIPTIITGPTGGGNHEDHEWVDVDSLKKLEEITVRFLADQHSDLK